MLSGNSHDLVAPELFLGMGRATQDGGGQDTRQTSLNHIAFFPRTRQES